MAKAGVVYVGTDAGLITYSDPGGTGRWRRVGQTLDGQIVRAILAADALTLTVLLGDGSTLSSTDGAQSWGNAPLADTERLKELEASEFPLIATAQGVVQWKGGHPPVLGATVMALLAGREEVMLAAIAGGTSLLRSENGGAAWQEVTLESPLRGAITTIMPSSYHMDIAWAGTNAGQILYSSDRGRSWSEAASEPVGVNALAVLRLV